MTLKSFGSFAVASLFVLTTLAAQAWPGDDNHGGPGGPGRGDDHGGGRGPGPDRGPGPGRGDDHGGGRGPGYPGPGHGGGFPGNPGHGGGPNFPPGHGGPGPGPRPPAPYPNPYPQPAPRPPSYPPPGYGRIAVPLQINTHMYNSTSINLSQFVDLNYYGGYRVLSVDVNARSSFNSSILDLFVNGYSAQSVVLSPYNQVYSLYVNNLVLGYGANLILSNRGDLDVYGVTLQLSR